MEAQGHRFGGFFPGYNGSILPRSMQSAQGKGKITKRQSICGERPGFFELLATVAGEFLQNDRIVRKNNDDIKHKKSKNDVKPLVMDTQFVNNMQVVMQNSSIDLVETSLLPHNVEDLKLSKKGNDTENVYNYCCTNLSRYNSLSLHGLPIPSFVKSTITNETTYQHESLSSKKNGDQFKVSLEFEDTPLMKHNEVLKIVDRRPNVFENEDHFLAIKNKDEFMDIDETKSHISQKNLNYNKQLLILNQSHGSICENHNPFHSLDINTKALNNKIQFNSPLENDKFVQNKNLLFRELGTNLDTSCASKFNIQQFESNLTSVDLKTMEENQSSNFESMIIDEIHLDCSKNHTISSYVENMQYTNCKCTKKHMKTMTNDVENQNQSKCEKKENTKEQSFSQCQYNEIMTNVLLQENANGSRSNSTSTLCATLQDSKAKPKETGLKPIENLTSSKQTFFNGIAAFTRQRTSRRLPLKRKRLDESDIGSSNLQVKTNVSNHIDIEHDCVYGEPPAAAAKLRSAKAASVASSPTTKRNTKQSNKFFVEPHVKLGIKSFAVPEFFVDLPESSSILTLKRAIIDAAMNLLGGGLQVHILMHGKKVTDEGATLLQSGISKNLKPESLGFMLEPGPIPNSPSATFEDPLLVLSRPSNQTSPWFQGSRVSKYSQSHGAEFGGQGMTYGKGNSSKIMGGCSFHNEDPSLFQSRTCGVDQRISCMSQKRNTTTISYSTTTMHDDQLKSNNPNAGKTITTKSNLTERIALSPHSTRIAAVGALAAIRAQADANHRLKSDVDTPISSNNQTLFNSFGGGSNAIILHPTIGMQDNMPGLALLSMQSKSHSLDIEKRRVRRPFSVAEVEALVHAVEKLGTGRWRDVKLRAFEQAKHRTYVDLKDKWKTLVHTARIAPHQRRGEPVPQELLERVTCAHTYWMAQAAKQQAELDF